MLMALTAYLILVAAFDDEGEAYARVANEVLPLVAASAQSHCYDVLSVWRASPISWTDEGRRRLGIYLA